MHPLLLYTLISNWAKSLLETYINFRQWRVISHAENEPPELSAESTEARRTLYSKMRASNMRRNETKMFFGFCDILSVTTTLCLYQPAKKWEWVINHANGSTWRPVMYVMSETLVHEIVRLPLSLLVFFSIRQSFNNQPVMAFITIFLAQAFLKTALYGISTYYTVYFLESFGSDVFIWLWIFWMVSASVITPVYVDLVLPSLEEYAQLQSGSLKDKIERLATEVGFPFSHIYITRGNNQSDEDHIAYFAGLFNSKAIIISASLVLFLTEEEIVAVVAHEMGHWRLGHSWYYLISRAIYSFCVCFFLRNYYDNGDVYEAFKIDPSNAGMSFLLVTSYLYPPLERVLKIYLRSVTRRCEFQADEFAKQHGLVNQLKSALRKMYEKKKIFPVADPWYSICYYSHPSILERVQAL